MVPARAVTTPAGYAAGWSLRIFIFSLLGTPIVAERRTRATPRDPRPAPLRPRFRPNIPSGKAVGPRERMTIGLSAPPRQPLARCSALPGAQGIRDYRHVEHLLQQGAERRRDVTEGGHRH